MYKCKLLLLILTFTNDIRLALTAQSHLRRLYDHLLADYSPYVRPIVDISKPTVVIINPRLYQLIDVVSFIHSLSFTYYNTLYVNNTAKY